MLRLKLLRALIVGPDQHARREIAKRLSMHHFDSVEAEHGVGALQFSSDIAIDLIVADIDLRDLDAVHLLNIVKCGAFGQPPPPVIVCSARVDGETWTMHPALTGATCLPKSFSEDEFEAALRAAFPPAA